METEDTMEIEKKVYNTPGLVEHGNLIEMTQDGNSGGGTDPFGSESAKAPIPF